MTASVTRITLDYAVTSPEARRHFLAKEREEFSVDNLALALIRRNGKAVGGDKQGSVGRALLSGNGWITRTVPVGRDVYIVGVPWRPLGGLRDHLWVLLAYSLSSLIAGACGAWILVGRTLLPMALLSDQANTISTESLRIHLREPSSDAEIVRLVATLNGLLARQSEVAEAKGRFCSAASHELRTPLQALSGHLELALSQQRGTETYRQMMEEAYRQTRRIIALVGDLLLLYRLESDSPQPSSQPGDLASVCRQALVSCQQIIQQRGLNVSVRLAEEAEFCAPSTHAQVLVRNLMENAAKYAEQGSELFVDLSVRDEQIELRIFNKLAATAAGNGSEIPPGSQNSGSGLGLAICHAVAAANSWKLTVERQEGGVCAILTIPPGAHGD